MYEIRLSVPGFADSDARERAELTRALAGALEAVPSAELHHPAANPPPGAKGSALDWAQLALGFTGSLPALLSYLRSWQQQHRGASVTIEIGGDRLVLEHASRNEQRALVDSWLERHGGG